MLEDVTYSALLLLAKFARRIVLKVAQTFLSAERDQHMREPSILLIDDDEKHADYLKMLKLEEKDWIVRVAIDKTLDGAVKKATKEIEENEGGFTILILDVKWPTDDKGGVRILNKLSEKHFRSLPIRKGLIMSGASIPNDPELSRLANVLHMEPEWWTLQLTTPLERQRLKKVLLEIWDEINPQRNDRG